MIEYSLKDLCSENLFINDNKKDFSQSRYLKILSILFKFGYHYSNDKTKKIYNL